MPRSSTICWSSEADQAGWRHRRKRRINMRDVRTDNDTHKHAGEDGAHIAATRRTLLTAARLLSVFLLSVFSSESWCVRFREADGARNQVGTGRNLRQDATHLAHASRCRNLQAKKLLSAGAGCSLGCFLLCTAPLLPCLSGERRLHPQKNHALRGPFRPHPP